MRWRPLIGNLPTVDAGACKPVCWILTAGGELLRLAATLNNRLNSNEFLTTEFEETLCWFGTEFFH